MSHLGYPNPLAIAAVAERLREACATTIHEFWPDDVSLLDIRVADPGRIHGRASSPRSTCSRSPPGAGDGSSPSTPRVPRGAAKRADEVHLLVLHLLVL